MSSLRRALPWILPLLLVAAFFLGPRLREAYRDPPGTEPPLQWGSGAHADSLYVVLGCFWTTEAWLGSMNGVIRTRVGYAGGTHPSPDWRNTRDHGEAVEVVYDPRQVPLDSLLLSVYAFVHPLDPAEDSCYAPALYFTRQNAAEQARQVWRRVHGIVSAPRLEGLATFHPAREFNQKHSLRVHELAGSAWKEMRTRDHFLLRSTAAARLNGWLAGFGDREDIRRDLPLCRLDPELEQALDRLLLEGSRSHPEEPGVATVIQP